MHNLSFISLTKGTINNQTDTPTVYTTLMVALSSSTSFRNTVDIYTEK